MIRKAKPANAKITLPVWTPMTSICSKSLSLGLQWVLGFHEDQKHGGKLMGQHELFTKISMGKTCAQEHGTNGSLFSVLINCILSSSSVSHNSDSLKTCVQSQNQKSNQKFTDQHPMQQSTMAHHFNHISVTHAHPDTIWRMLNLYQFRIILAIH